jgi:hypothetical protein
MENKNLMAGKRENKLNDEITKLLKISRISVYYTLKNFGPTSFSSHKNQRKTTKNDDDICDHKQAKSSTTASDITSEMNQSLPMYASCIQ